MKNKLILRIGALAFAMATVFTVSLQKNIDLVNNDAVALADGDIIYVEVGGVSRDDVYICKCKRFTTKAICSLNCGGVQCASFVGNGNCSAYDLNCR